jgi:hypothetical protein
MPKKQTKPTTRKGKAAPPRSAPPTITHAVTDASLSSAGILAGDKLLGRLVAEDERGGSPGHLIMLLLDAGDATETAAGFYESVPESEDPACVSFRLRSDGGARLLTTGDVIGWYEPRELWRELHRAPIYSPRVPRPSREPKNKKGRAWREWKVRQMSAALASGDYQTAKPVIAEWLAMFDKYRAGESYGIDGMIAMLPFIIQELQERER